MDDDGLEERLEDEEEPKGVNDEETLSNTEELSALVEEAIDEIELSGEEMASLLGPAGFEAHERSVNEANIHTKRFLFMHAIILSPLRDWLYRFAGIVLREKKGLCENVAMNLEGMYGIHHIIYLVVFAILISCEILFLRKYKLSDKAVDWTIRIAGAILLFSFASTASPLFLGT